MSQCTPSTTIKEKNSEILFERALKLTNSNLASIIAGEFCHFQLSSEALPTNIGKFT
jgi:hypothetical protein